MKKLMIGITSLLATLAITGTLFAFGNVGGSPFTNPVASLWFINSSGYLAPVGDRAVEMVDTYITGNVLGLLTANDGISITNTSNDKSIYINHDDTGTNASIDIDRDGDNAGTIYGMKIDTTNAGAGDVTALKIGVGGITPRLQFGDSFAIRGNYGNVVIKPYYTGDMFKLQNSSGTDKVKMYFDTGNISFTGKSINVVDSDTIADSGDGNPATHTLTPTSSYVELTCNDVHGCDITMDETGALTGQDVEITNVSANVCNFTDTAGVTELAGNFAMGQYDYLMMKYSSASRYIEKGRSGN